MPGRICLGEWILQPVLPPVRGDFVTTGKFSGPAMKAKMARDSYAKI
jgi:hypothetical protein